MKSLDSFLPWLLPYVAGCTDMLAKQMILDACIEFCEATALVQTVETQDVTAGLDEYDVSAPGQQELTLVVKAYFNSAELKPVALEEVRHGAAARAAVDSVVPPSFGTPTMYHQTTPSDAAIYLWPVPDTTVSGALAIRAAFQPLRSATQVEDILYDDYVQTITYGAAARLMSIPDQPFTNQKLAQSFEKRFSAAIATAANLARTGLLRSGLRVQPRAFA